MYREISSVNVFTALLLLALSLESSPSQTNNTPNSQHAFYVQQKLLHPSIFFLQPQLLHSHFQATASTEMLSRKRLLSGVIADI